MRTRAPTSEHRRATRSAIGGAPHTVSRRLRPYLWPLAVALVIALLLPLRGELDKAHVTLALLLVVLVAAADGGRVVGLLCAGLAFLGFNWFFLPPYGTLVVADPLDWFVLFAFLGTSVVASHLFHRVQREADEARERTGEVVTLATLGAEAMTAARADQALRAVADAAREMLGAATCRVHVVRDARPHGTAAAKTDAPSADIASVVSGVADSPTGDAESRTGDADPVRLALDRGVRVAVLDGGIVRILPAGESSLQLMLAGTSVRRLLIPLLGGSRALGVLDVEDDAGLALDTPREHLLGALAYYAALGAERSRSEQAAEHLEAMREAERMRNAVLASVSHDLRTPLTTIKALAHELGALGDERSEVIEQEADRLNRFVADMLDLSRLASGGFPLRPTINPVDELVTAALQQVEGSYCGRRIDVQLPGDDAFPLARFDLSQTVRIVVNLLENARKYAPGETPVTLTVAREGTSMHIAVADRGPGVAPDESERIFDALYRPTSSRPDVGSAGLGLAIARGLAEAQGGTLTYAPRAGGGSVFTLTLPAAELADIAPESAEGADSAEGAESAEGD